MTEKKQPKKNHLGKLAGSGEGGVKAEDFHQSIFGSADPAPEQPEESTQPQKNATQAPDISTEKMVQRCFMIPASLLIAFQRYRICEMEEKVDSKAFIKILQDLLESKGYWPPQGN